MELATQAAEKGIEIIANPVSAVRAAHLDVIFQQSIGASIVASLAEANALNGKATKDALSAAQTLIERGAVAALVTNGAKPAALVTSAGFATATPPELNGAHSVTGAGDALLAAFLATPNRNSDPHSTLITAINAAAAHMKAKP